MRVHTKVLFLFISLTIFSCKKKAAVAPKEDPYAPKIFRSSDGVISRIVIDGKQIYPVVETPTTAPPTATTPAPSETAEATAETEVAEAEHRAVEIAVGWTYVIGQGDQTVVMNPKPVSDGLRRFARGSVCRFDAEGKVKIIGKHRAKLEDEEYDDYLVRYMREPAAEALRAGALEYPDSEPYECPTGTVFFLEDTTTLENDEPDERYEAARQLLNSEKP